MNAPRQWFAHQDGANNMRDGLTERQRHARLINGFSETLGSLIKLDQMVRGFDDAPMPDGITREECAEWLSDRQRDALDMYERIMFPPKEAA